MNCGIGRRCSLDPVLLWLWHSLTATSPIRPLTWESPYAMGAALEKTKDENKQKKPNSISVRMQVQVQSLALLNA